MRRAVALGIDLYQHHLSPLKGFTCAHDHLYGRGSCSRFARRVVLRWGVLRLVPLLRLRFMACRQAFIALSTVQPPAKCDDGKAADDTADDELFNSCALTAITAGCCSLVPW
jgi:putative component of membrane protein insertase Oxa1/YidC/SpoIIIJ protein YidD